MKPPISAVDPDLQFLLRLGLLEDNFQQSGLVQHPIFRQPFRTHVFYEAEFSLQFQNFVRPLTMVGPFSDKNQGFPWAAAKTVYLVYFVATAVLQAVLVSVLVLFLTVARSH